MTDPDARLRALFEPSAPPLRDPVFSAAVMALVMRRQFYADGAFLCLASLIVALLLGALWPWLTQPIMAMCQGLNTVLVGLALAGSIGVILSGRLSTWLGLER